MDGAAFIFIPDNGTYSVKFEATDQGSFDFKIRKFENDTIASTVLYSDVSLTVSTKAQATLDTLSSQPPILAIDQDGNGIIDSNVSSTVTLIGDDNYDEAPASTSAPTATPAPTSTPIPTSTPTSTPTFTLALTPAIVAKSNETLMKNETGNVVDQVIDVAGVSDVVADNGNKQKQDILGLLALTVIITPQLLLQINILTSFKKFW